MSSGVSDDENNDYIEKPKLSKHEIFQKIADVEGLLKEHGNLKTQENQLSIFERSLQNRLLNLKKVSNNSEPTLYTYFLK